MGEAKRRRAPKPKAKGNLRTKAGAGSPKGNTGLEAAGCGRPLPSQEGLERRWDGLAAAAETKKIAKKLRKIGRKNL